MSVRTRWALAVIGLVIFCLALVGLAYSLWPLDGTQERFVLPVELMVLLWG
jgi:hypothetical protein